MTNKEFIRQALTCHTVGSLCFPTKEYVEKAQEVLEKLELFETFIKKTKLRSYVSEDGKATTHFYITDKTTKPLSESEINLLKELYEREE